ncbi:MAG: amino acid permease, partial [Acidobacteriaceae bacterium]|nr:amino acid permease [Acidobacteriaceae bacterium]
GLYVYLRAAFGESVGFLYGWGLLSLIHSGSIATLASAFGLYASQLFPLSGTAEKLAGITTILLLTLLNSFGLRAGKWTQNVVTGSKVGGIALMVVLLFASSRKPDFNVASKPGPPLALAIGAALVAVLWAYEGWHTVSFTSAEFRNPVRDFPRSMYWGAAALVTIYLCANLAYFHVLSPGQLQATDRPAALAVQSAYGGPAAALITALIVISILGAMNGMVLTGARVYYAMARDGVFFAPFGRLNAARVPMFSLLVQGVWASCLTLAGSFQQLFTYVIFTAWIFYGMSVFAVIVLRRTAPGLPRPFRTPGYPLVPILFSLAALFIAVVTVANGPLRAFYGIALILIGLPVYWLRFRRRTA